MARTCAYCGASNMLTREHIWPAGIIKRVNYDVRYSEKANKFFGADLVISDVCKTCNNGVLSKLDDYICNLYDNFFKDFRLTGDTTEFKYDYNLLSKWLLKISYNSLRSSGENRELLEAYVPYILGDELIHNDKFSIRLEIVPPSTLATISKEETEIVVFPPATTRCCRIEFQGGKLDWCILRLVSINSFYFWLIFTPEDIIVPDEEISFLLSYLPNCIIEPESSQVNVKTSTRDMLNYHGFWFNKQKAAMEEFMENQK